MHSFYLETLDSGQTNCYWVIFEKLRQRFYSIRILGGAAMKISELVRVVKQSVPKQKSLTAQEARRLVQGLFTHIDRVIDGTPEGVIKVPGLGRFRVKRGCRKQDGREVPITRISFKAKTAEQNAD
jgi:hypothetical protein